MKRAARASVLLAASLLCGCTALAPVNVEMTSAVLDRAPSDVPRAARKPDTLLVLPPQARPMYDTTQMAYTLRPHHLAYFTRNQWAEAPAQMLQPLLVRTLEATGRFGAVLTPPASTPAWLLQAELLELVQDFAEDPPVLRVAFRLRLVDEHAHRTVGVREFQAREPMQQKTPYAGVVAANAALARALREAAAFVIERTP